MPEGVLLNYLARLPNPTPYVNFMPPELVLFGEAAMLAALEGAPPDAICIVHKDTSEYGVRFFGRDYGQALRAWVDRRYAPAGGWGDEPLAPGTGFGIRLLERRR